MSWLSSSRAGWLHPLCMTFAMGILSAPSWWFFVLFPSFKHSEHYKINTLVHQQRNSVSHTKKVVMKVFGIFQSVKLARSVKRAKFTKFDWKLFLLSWRAFRMNNPPKPLLDFASQSLFLYFKSKSGSDYFKISAHLAVKMYSVQFPIWMGKTISLKLWERMRASGTVLQSRV